MTGDQPDPIAVALAAIASDPDSEIGGELRALGVRRGPAGYRETAFKGRFGQAEFELQVAHWRGDLDPADTPRIVAHLSAQLERWETAASHRRSAPSPRLTLPPPLNPTIEAIRQTGPGAPPHARLPRPDDPAAWAEIARLIVEYRRAKRANRPVRATTGAYGPGGTYTARPGHGRKRKRRRKR